MEKDNIKNILIFGISVILAFWLGIIVQTEKQLQQEFIIFDESTYTPTATEYPTLIPPPPPPITVTPMVCEFSDYWKAYNPQGTLEWMGNWDVPQCWYFHSDEKKCYG